jgi:alpha-1,2-mannosyltransferase
MNIAQTGMTAEKGSRPRGLTSSALTRYLAIFLLLNGFVLSGILWVASPEPYKETVLNHTWDVLQGRGCDDSWGIMSTSLEYARTPHETPLYTEIFFNRHLKFQYPPSSLFAIAGLLWLVGPDHIRTEECRVFDLPTANDILGWIFLLISALSAAALLEIGLRQLAIPSTRRERVARTIIVLALALTFYPLVKAYTLGQIQNWLNGLFALALLCWVRDLKAPSGVLIGLMALVKPHYGLFLLWAALRREWGFAFAFAATLVIVVSASIAVYGWANHVDYLRVLSYLAERGETYYPNQSANGVLNRVMTLVDPTSWYSLTFNDNAFPPFSWFVYGGTLIASIILLASALLHRRHECDPDRTFDLCTMMLSITMASPIAWEHHYGTIFPVFAVLLTSVIGDRRRLILLTVSYVLISTFVPATNLLAETMFNVAQSYLLAGAIVVLVLLHTARRAEAIVTVPAATPVPATATR